MSQDQQNIQPPPPPKLVLSYESRRRRDLMRLTAAVLNLIILTPLSAFGIYFVATHRSELPTPWIAMVFWSALFVFAVWFLRYSIVRRRLDRVYIAPGDAQDPPQEQAGGAPIVPAQSRAP